MSTANRQLAEKVVHSFKENLDNKVQAQISDAQYEELALMIMEALSEKTDDVIEQFENVVKKLRTSIHKLELDL